MSYYDYFSCSLVVHIRTATTVSISYNWNKFYATPFSHLVVIIKNKTDKEIGNSYEKRKTGKRG